MAPQLYCPRCGNKAMNLWQKLMLSQNSKRPCRSCGHILSIEKSATGWFVFGWIPFSLSGLFPLPLKLVLGCIGIGLMMFPYFFLVPLVEKTEGLVRKFPIWLTAWLSILLLGMFASEWVNLIPSSETKIFAACVSVILALVIVKEFWNRIPKPDEKLLAVALGFVLLVGMHFFTLSNLPPALFAYFSGETGVVSATVLSKSHTNKLTRCSNKIDVVFVIDDTTQKLCLSESIWKNVKQNDLVTIKFRETLFGRLVTEVEASN